MPGQSAAASVPDHRVHRVQAEGHWLDNDELYVCVAQLPRSSSQIMGADGRRPSSVNAIRSLWNDPAATNRGLAGGTRPILVVAPELSMGSSDWADIDEHVRAASQNVILIIGCGFVLGADIQRWLDTDPSPTRRIPGWPAEERLEAASRYNMGFAWVRTGAACSCIAFLKNFPEQRVELNSIAPTLGRWHLRVDTNDLVVFPGICADLLGHVLEDVTPGSLARRADSSLAQERPQPSHRVVVTGSLLELKPWHDRWTQATSHLADRLGANTVIVLANDAPPTVSPALDCHPPGVDDAWRNRSGVYKRRPNPDEHDNSPKRLILPKGDATLIASVVRHTFPLLQAGTIRWTSSSTSGQYLWNPKARAVLDAAGNVVTVEDGDPFEYEVVRACARVFARDLGGAEPPDVADQYRRECLRSVRTVLSAQDAAKAAAIGSAIVCGIFERPPCTETWAMTPGDAIWNGHLAEGLQGLGCVTGLGTPTWSSIAGSVVTFLPVIDKLAWLVWSSPCLSSMQMERSLATWRGQSADATDMVVVGASKEHHFRDGALPEVSREDVTSPHQGNLSRDFTRPATNRRVRCVALPRVLAACASGAPDPRNAVAHALRTVTPVGAVQ